jgi:sugar lactone lactonase YvrE
VQVFRKDGTFVSEVIIAPKTLYPGSVDDIAFSPDTRQRFMYIADNMNKRVWIVARESLAILGHFGEGGNHGGQFNMPHSIATDSAGNIYVTETLEGKRIQRFLFTGVK